MTLKQWAENSWLRAHATTSEEIDNLFQIVDRDLKDARAATDSDADELIEFVESLKEEVMAHLENKYPELIGIR